MKFCKHCGEKLKEDAKFCKHCGENLQSEEHQGTEQTEHLARDEEQQASVPEGDLQEEKQTSNENEMSTQTDDSSSKKTDEQTTEAEVSATAHLPSDRDQNGKSSDDHTPMQQNGKHSKKQTQSVDKKVKKRNTFIVSGVALVVLLIAAYVTIDKMNSPTKLVKEFETAMEDGDVETLTSILTAEEDQLEVNKGAVESFIAFYESNSTDFRNMIAELEHQADGSSSDHGIAPVELDKKGKKFLLFDNYQLVLLPVYINVSTNYEDTDIYVNDEKLATTDEEYFTGEVGPVTPGVHQIKAVYDTGVFNLDKEEEVAVGNPNNAEMADLYLDGDSVTFDLTSNGYDQLSSVMLLINGEETDYDLVKDDTVEPLPTDGSMNASFAAEFPWGTMTTDDVAIEDTYIEFNFGSNPEFRQEMMDLIVQYNEEYLEAITKADKSIFTTTLDPLAEDIVELASAMKEDNAVFKGSFHGIDFYEESFILNYTQDDYWEIEVDTITYLEEDIYEKGKKADLQKVEDEVRYMLVFDPSAKEWVVGNTTYAGSMDEDKMERYKVDDPKTYTSEWGKKKKGKKKK